MDFNNICPHCMKQLNNGSICMHCNNDPRILPPPGYHLRPFTILKGKYLVGGILGEGGFGITYKGLDLNLQMPVAIKEFYPSGCVTRESMVTSEVTVYASIDSSSVQKWQDGFLWEARCLAKCSNLPGVVGVKDFFQENNTVYIVQEFLEGITLRNYVKLYGGRMPADELIRNIEPIIKALYEVHKQGIIHRDISPDNIMLLNNGTMKVLDFGAARSFAEENEKSKSILLKHGYAPEEQYRTRGKQGPWTDVYALCATMYKCITGKTPLEAMDRLRQDEIMWPTEMGISISENFENVLKKGMAVFSENRYQDMQQLYDALYTNGNCYVYNPPIQPPVNNETLTPTIQQTVQPTIQPEKKKSGKPLVITLIAVCLCAVIAIAAVFVMEINKDEKEVANSKKTEHVSEENAEPVEETVKMDASEAIEKMEELKDSMDDLEDISNANKILGSVAEIRTQFEEDEEVQSISIDIYDVYYDKMIEYIDMIKDIKSFDIAYYKECKLRFDELEEWNTKLNCDYGEKIGNDRESCKKEFKNKYVKQFDEECLRTLNENGVISRSVAWDILGGIDTTDLYNADNAENSDYRFDSLRIRYIVAKVYNIHKEVGNMNKNEAIEVIKDAMVECDYDPMLVYLLTLNGYEPAQAWLQEIEYILYSVANINGYSYSHDNDRLNFVYEYNTDIQKYEECKSKIIKYMKNYYY